MEFAEFQRLVDALLADHASRGYPATIRILDALLATDDDLSFVERQLDTRLPAEYKRVVKTYGAGMFGFVELLPVRAGSDGGYDVLVANTGHDTVSGFVAIAPVGSGDMWGFVARNGNCEEAVSIWFHDTGDIETDSSDFLEFLASRGLRGSR
jgi:hypothetical protein